MDLRLRLFVHRREGGTVVRDGVLQAAAEPEGRRVRIGGHRHRPPVHEQRAQQALLARRDVLVVVDQQVARPDLDVVCDLGVILQECDRERDRVRRVDHVPVVELVQVPAEEPGRLLQVRPPREARALLELVGRFHRVLRAQHELPQLLDEPRQVQVARERRPVRALLVAGQHLLDQGELLRPGQQARLTVEAERAVVQPQDAQRERMPRRDAHVARGAPELPQDPFLQRARRAPVVHQKQGPALPRLQQGDRTRDELGRLAGSGRTNQEGGPSEIDISHSAKPSCQMLRILTGGWDSIPVL